MDDEDEEALPPAILSCEAARDREASPFNPPAANRSASVCDSSLLPLGSELAGVGPAEDSSLGRSVGASAAHTGAEEEEEEEEAEAEEEEAPPLEELVCASLFLLSASILRSTLSSSSLALRIIRSDAHAPGSLGSFPSAAPSPAPSRSDRALDPALEAERGDLRSLGAAAASMGEEAAAAATAAAPAAAPSSLPLEPGDFPPPPARACPLPFPFPCPALPPAASCLDAHSGHMNSPPNATPCGLSRANSFLVRGVSRRLLIQASESVVRSPERI